MIVAAVVLAFAHARCDGNVFDTAQYAGPAQTMTFRGRSIVWHGMENRSPWPLSQIDWDCQSRFTARICGQDYVWPTPTHEWEFSVGPFDGLLDYAGTSGASILHVAQFGGTIPAPACLASGALIEASCEGSIQVAVPLSDFSLASRDHADGVLVIE